MRKILLLTSVAALSLAGVAYGALNVSNDYVVTAKITPKKSGTTAHPKSISRFIGWDVTTAPPGQRPANDRGYKIATVGIQQHTRDFPGCGTTKLATNGPGGCPRGSFIGSGFAIIEVGPSGDHSSSFNGKCRADEDLFNGGNNNETLYVFEGKQHHGQPGPCPIPGHHAIININLTRDHKRMVETFSVPLALLHPAPGTDATTIHQELNIPAKSKSFFTGRRGHRRFHHVGLFESFFCPPNGQRQVAVTFTREDGAGRTRTTLVSCKS